MQSKLIFVCLSLSLFSCSNDKNILSSEIETSSQTSITDFTHFDQRIVGLWYVYSSSMGELDINEEIEVFTDYTLKIKDTTFNYMGVYNNFEGTNMFISESGITTFICGFDDDNLSWAFKDETGISDWGIAKKEKSNSQYNYNYIGSTWPNELIKSFLNTTDNIPAYPSDEYNVLLSDTSSLYGEVKNIKIDIFSLPSSALLDYVEILSNNGYSIKQNEGSSFYIGYDEKLEYGLRITYFTDTSNLTIFIYNYASIQQIF